MPLDLVQRVTGYKTTDIVLKHADPGDAGVLHAVGGATVRRK
jgi:hypothetical protein